MARERKPQKEYAPPTGFVSAGMQYWKPEKAGEELRGHYIQSVEVASRGKGKVGKGKKNTFLSHHIAKLGTGDLIGVSGASLNSQFETVKPHTEVLIVFNGIVKLAGGKQMKSFQVYKRDEKKTVERKPRAKREKAEA